MADRESRRTVTSSWRKVFFETLYKNRYLYRFASTVPFAGQWRVWQRLVLPRLVGKDVLELGCGLGDLLADMLQAGYHCRAVEHSPQMVAAARETLQRRHVGLPSTVVQGAAQRLPFQAESFDAVVSTFPSEYIYDPETLSEIERVLRPGGRLIVIESANLFPIGIVQPLLVLMHMLVYGPRVLFGPRGWRPAQGTFDANGRGQSKEKAPILHIDRETNTGVTTEVLPRAAFGHAIPLERFDLQRRSERVLSRRWEVYITIGEKPSRAKS